MHLRKQNYIKKIVNTKIMMTALTTMMAILPPTSPTTLIGGFSLAGCWGTPTVTSIVRDGGGGGGGE